jgi:hypothetical protein
MFGMLAKKAGYRLLMKVCYSAAGYYIGTLDDNGFPVSRESAEYFVSNEEAEWTLINNKFTQRSNP